MTRSEVFLSIAEAARLVGVSPATLRNWERQGHIIPTRTPKGHRRFTLDDVATLRQFQGGSENGQLAAASQDDQGTDTDTDEARSSPQLYPNTAPTWADKLKRLRAQRGFSLRQVSAMTTLSPSFISEIERGQANPSVGALQKLTASYGVSIVELMEEPASEPRTLVRVDDRQNYAVTAGVRMEQLNFGPHQMELHLFTVDPGAGTGETYHHAGEEFIFLLSGELVVWIDRVERYALEPGDVLYFSSSRLHEWINSSDEPAVFLGVNTPPTF
jgi:excisionase family DNA binding protein